jgi:uncharacterized protein YraI
LGDAPKRELRVFQHALTVAGLVRAIVASCGAMALMAAPPPFTPVPTTWAADGIALPFPGGQAVRIIQGYNGGSHQGRSRYALDLVLAAGGTSGAEVVAPIEGSVSWANAPGAANGCMAIAFRDGSYSVTLCHVQFNRSYRWGESIAVGKSLGTVGRAGAVGNNGTPHVHMELHRGGRSGNPVPFGPPDGLPLEGVALPASGAHGEHSSRAPLVSTNGTGSGAQSSNAQAEQPTPQPASPAVGRSGDSSGPPASGGQRSARAAVVQRTGSCLNVREKPSADAPVVDCLADGTEVPLMPRGGRADQGWRQIEGKGWAASEYLKRTRAVVAGTESCLNVRESPSTSASIVGCLPESTSVTIAEGPSNDGEHEWYRIGAAGAVQNGGWVVAQHLD